MEHPAYAYLYNGTASARNSADLESQYDLNTPTGHDECPTVHTIAGCIVSVVIIGTCLYYASQFLNNQAFTLLCILLLFAVGLYSLVLGSRI
jgi:hypothetical protein